MNSEDPQPPVHRAKKRYLVFPWLGIFAIAIVTVTGLEQSIASILPFRIPIPWRFGFIPGMLLLLVVCSALWSYGFLRQRGARGAELRVKMMFMTLLITAGQLCLAAGIVYAGCIIISIYH